MAANVAKPDALMALRTVNFHCGAFHALNGIDLDIFKNRVVAFIEPSGSGKSILVDLINRKHDL